MAAAIALRGNYNSAQLILVEPIGTRRQDNVAVRRSQRPHGRGCRLPGRRGVRPRRDPRRIQGRRRVRGHDADVELVPIGANANVYATGANINAARRYEKDYFINIGDKAKEDEVPFQALLFQFHVIIKLAIPDC